MYGSIRESMHFFLILNIAVYVACANVTRPNARCVFLGAETRLAESVDTRRSERKQSPSSPASRNRHKRSMTTKIHSLKREKNKLYSDTKMTAVGAQRSEKWQVENGVNFSPFSILMAAGMRACRYLILLAYELNVNCTHRK